MINKKWLIVSFFLPVWGVFINLFLVQFYIMRHWNFIPKRVMIRRFFTAIGVVFLGMTVGGLAGTGLCLLYELIFKLEAPQQLCLWIILILLSVSGNLAFFWYYKKAFSDVDKLIVR